MTSRPTSKGKSVYLPTALMSDVAKNLIGIFLNTRAAGKLPRIKGLEPAKIKKVAMLGGGVMGSGIVHLLLANGFEAALWEIDDEAVEKATDRDPQNLRLSHSKKRK